MDSIVPSSPYMTHHVRNPVPPPPTATHILQPKSTIGSILLEPGTGKTTVIGNLVPAESHMLETYMDAEGEGLQALARAADKVKAVLEVHLVLGSAVGLSGIDADREQNVLRALGLMGHEEPLHEAQDVPMALIKSEPEWTDSSYTPYESSSTAFETSDPASRAATPRLQPAAFRPFRPTTSKLAIFQSQSQSRKAGLTGRRRLRDQAGEGETSPSNIFSRTRSRTRLGMGSMLEQVANVSNVVRLARKNPSALVERFLSGYTATSPVKHKGSGFTIDALPRLSVRASVKTLNIATGSSKKRKVVSVVLDDAGRPVRWGAGTVLPPAVNVVPVNHVPMPTTSAPATTTAVKTAARTTKASGKNDQQQQFGRNLPICSNCGITESNTWRTKGKGGVRVCNGESGSQPDLYPLADGMV